VSDNIQYYDKDMLKRKEMRDYMCRTPRHGHTQESTPSHVYGHNEFLDLILCEYYVHNPREGNNMRLLQPDLHLRQLIPFPYLLA